MWQCYLNSQAIAASEHVDKAVTVAGSSVRQLTVLESARKSTPADMCQASHSWQYGPKKSQYGPRKDTLIQHSAQQTRKRDFQHSIYQVLAAQPCCAPSGR
jgi:hypothetical protein